MEGLPRISLHQRACPREGWRRSVYNEGRYVDCRQKKRDLQRGSANYGLEKQYPYRNRLSGDKGWNGEILAADSTTPPGPTGRPALPTSLFQGLAKTRRA